MRTPIIWSDLYNTKGSGYVRQIFSISINWDGKYGMVKDSKYLGEDEKTKAQIYENGNLFIICEMLEPSTSYKYTLIRIDSSKDKGIEILGVTPELHDYPYPENILVKIILQEILSGRISDSIKTNNHNYFKKITTHIFHFMSVRRHFETLKDGKRVFIIEHQTPR